MASTSNADADLDEADDKSDKMSSVSKCSNFSLKSQQYIAKQDCQMAVMRKAMIAAGLDPDLVLAEADAEVEVVMDMEVDVTSKKRPNLKAPLRMVWVWVANMGHLLKLVAAKRPKMGQSKKILVRIS